jgi:hypothetical protein
MESLETRRTPQRQQIWDEARRLSEEVRFTTGRGCFLQGKQVCLVADMEPEEQGGGFRAGIIVFPLGSQSGDVEDWPVTLVGKTAFGWVLRHGQTNRRGDVIFHQLPEGEYSLRFPLARGRSEEPVVGVSHTWRDLAARTTAAEDLSALPLAAATKTQEESVPLEPKVYPSQDEEIQCTVRRTLSDELEVACETKRADLAGATVWFAFVEPETHRLLLEAEVRLEETEEPGVWEGIWLSEPDFRLEAEGELVFEVTGL